MLIGLTGRAGSGKDTAAAYLAQAHRFMPLAFATPIRQMLQIGLGLDEQDFTSANKSKVIARLDSSAHQLMQSLATDWGRTHVPPSAWIDLAADELDRTYGLDVVFTDVQREDEARLIHERGGFIVRLVRGGTALNQSHCHEAELQLLDSDREIHNIGTPYELYDKLDAIVGEAHFLGATL